VYNATDCYDFDVFGDGSQRVYESLAVWPNCDSILFCSWVRWESARCFYSVYLFACSDCFGCFGLRNAQYCIFNTQYTKEEYEQLVPEIIAQMQPEWTRWEFLSPSLSPFGYNETVAYDLEPLTKTQATQHWYNWTDYTNDIAIPVWAKTLVPWDFSPEEWKILRDDDAILNQIIVCEVTGRPFRVIKKELEICRMHDISLPTKHPDARHQEKLEARMWNTLFLRNCNKTGETMVSNYGAEFEGKVYSHKAYADEVYG
jgi:hypothetical protein